jgi:hypothetical protein
MKYSLFAAFVLLLLLNTTHVMAQKSAQEFYELRVYNYNGQDNENKLDKYFGEALVPALHRAGIKTVGVFKTSPADTISQKRMYVLIPYHSLDMIEKLSSTLAKDKTYLSAGADFLSAPYDASAFTRMEKIILKAFPTRPQLKKSTLTGDKQSRIYELRSYESPTEALFHNKVKMFNDGDEVGIFDKLSFNPIFYSEVIAGSHMPNLMYMTTFENKESRDEHWKAFGADDQWKKLSGSSEYPKNNVSHSDIRFLYPTDYSDL